MKSVRTLLMALSYFQEILHPDYSPSGSAFTGLTFSAKTPRAFRRPLEDAGLNVRRVDQTDVGCEGDMTLACPRPIRELFQARAPSGRGEPIKKGAGFDD